MPTFIPPKKNTAYTFYLSLISQANTKLAQANPTLAAGDVKVATDDGAPANLATLPVVDADFTKRVKVALSAAEMNGDNVTVIFSDAAGAEWADLTVNIQTVARQIDDLAFPRTSGRSLNVSPAGSADAHIVSQQGGVSLFADKVDAAVMMAKGTVFNATAATIELDAGALATDNYYVGAWIVAIQTAGGVPIAGGFQVRLCTAYFGSLKEATISPNWTTTPNASYLYIVIPAARMDTEFWRGALVNALIAGRVDANAQVVGDKTGYSLVANAVDAAQFTQAAADKVWTSATRTLTAFSTALALAVWDVLETAIAVASSIGVKAKTNLDATVSSRSSHSAADIWTVATRTVTSFGTLVADIWVNVTRTLTGSVGIKKNAALAAFEFVMYDSAGTPTPGLTVSGQRSIDGGAFAATANSPTEVSSGAYKIDLAATDVNGDMVTFRFTAPGAVDTFVTIKTVHA